VNPANKATALHSLNCVGTHAEFSRELGATKQTDWNVFGL
jgi:hypothetical protein